jgi:type VI secretion system protein ImpA
VAARAARAWAITAAFIGRTQRALTAGALISVRRFLRCIAQPSDSPAESGGMNDMSLLDALAPDAPCGPDLEYDPAFLALERSFEAAYVDRVVGPESETLNPDWKNIADQSLALLGRSRDLRVAVTLTKAWLHLRGLGGLARGLSLLAELVSQRWDDVHPQSAALGDNDAIMRASALRSLCDARSVLSALHRARLVSAPGLGELCLRDLEKLSASAQSGADPTEITRVEAIFTGCSLEALEASCNAVDAARDALVAIVTLFEERGAAPLRLPELTGPLDRMHGWLAPRLAARQHERALSAAEAEREESEAASQPTAAAASSARASERELTSGADVARELERLCAYYARFEPSSPVPLLLRRAQRLTGMQFFDIIRELAPAGVAEIEQLRGPVNPIASE